MEGMYPAPVDRSSGSYQRLSGDLATVDPVLPVRVIKASEDVDFYLLEVKQLDESV